MHSNQTFLAVHGVRASAKSFGIRLVSAVSAVTLIVVGVIAGAQPAQAAGTTTSTTLDSSKMAADPLPTTQIDGVAWTQLVAGDTVYVGGKFSNARPAGAAAGTNLTARTNLLAYKLSDGTLNANWNPGANGEVFGFAMSPDGSRLYVAGSFTSIGGQTRYRVAALNPTTGAVISTWAPVVNATVRSIAVKGDIVYLGGEFSTVNNATRTGIAAVSASTGALLPFSAQLVGGYGVRGVVVSPDGSKVVIAGSFTSTNGSTNPGRGMAALDAVTGASLPWAANSIARNAGNNASIYSLASDADSVYGTAYDYYGGAEDGLEGSFRVDWDTGQLIWLEDCHGDTYSVAPMGNEIFIAGHPHYCGNIGGFPQTNPWTFQHSMSFSKAPTGQIITADPLGYRSFTGLQAPTMNNWFPKWTPGTFTGIDQAAWSVAANDTYVVYGGEFTRVQGLNQQGLVRFAVKTAAPNKIGPQVQGGAWKLGTVSYRLGEVRLSWTANYDPDDASLHYEVLRRDKGSSSPLYTVDKNSNFWTTPLMSYTDKTVTPGQTYEYRIRVTDSKGNNTVTDWTPVTATPVSQATAYGDTVLAGNPSYYWPLGEDSGTTGFDWANGNDLTVNNAVRAASGMNLTQASKSTDFAGTSGSFATTTSAVTGPQQFSIEAWFNTTSTRGGKIVGFGNASTGNSGSYDRHVYLSNTGQVSFGVYPGASRAVTSAAGFNNGQWHHVVATMDASGMKLYLDDRLVGSRTDTTSAQAYDGYWRVGGDSLGSWPSAGSSGYADANISDVAIFDRALTRRDVDSHWVASGRTSALQPAPADAYGKSVYNLDPTLYWRLGEASGTTAADAGSNGNTGTYRNSVTRGQSGALNGVNNTAISVQGNGFVSSDASFVNPTTYAVEAWFKTTSTTGGKIVGFGNARTGNSSSYDRHVYMTGDGILHFGVYTGQEVTLDSAAALNDGKWHHVVAQQTADGMKLYIDGSLTAQNQEAAAQNYTGYWRVGGDSGWAGTGYFTGSIDDVAVYSQPLSGAQVEEHYEVGAFGSLNQLPDAGFSAVVSDLSVDLDASASTDADGTIASYRWDFGDGSAPETGTKATTTHTYAAAGTFQVTLTVTDNRGGTSSITSPVTVTEPNKDPRPEFTTTVDGLGVTVDATGSSDPDGTIVSYSWAFGDGATGLGATASHSYAQAGTYDVTLTVTDDAGASATKTIKVTVEKPANVAPTASFAAQAADLTANFDASASSDSDGSIVSYAWVFGDGATGSGATATHTYAQAGDYQVKLTVTDNQGATGVQTQTVTVSAPTPANVAPTAKFTSSVNNLAASFDGSGSTDSDGNVVSYAWTFGDGGSGTGATANHSYAQAGVYQVTLTVTDDDGATGSVTSAVTVTSGTITTLAADTFERTASNGWGTADTGGIWTVTGGSAAFSVANGKGTVVLAPSQSRWAMLNSVSAADTVSEVSFSTDQAFAGGAQAMNLIGRRVGGSDYQARVRVESGLLRLYILRDEAALTGSYVLNGAYVPGQVVHLKLSVTGTNPTAVAAKVWTTGSEPATWNLTATDNTSAMQSAGSVGIKTNIASTASAQTVFSYDNYSVTGPAAAPVGNVKPTAGFTSSVADLKVSVDGSSSTDSDGSITGYAWDFGDGASGTGKTASHTYAAAGEYDVKLTVTDNDGATDSVTKKVTVTVAPVGNVKPTAGFTSSVADLKVSVDGSSSTDSDGSVTGYVWDFGDGASGTGKTASHTYAAAGEYDVKLTVTDNDGATDSVTKKVTVTAAPGSDVLAEDSFERTETSGWGAAETGGSWTASGGAAALSVSDGKGRLTLAPSQTRQALLRSISTTDAVVETTVAADKAVSGAPMSITVIGRQVGNSIYSARFRVETSGAIRLYILRDETSLGDSYLIPNTTYSAGDVYHVKLKVTGTSPTTVSAKVWKAGADEPSAWRLTATDNNASMQAAGYVGVVAYVSGASGNTQTVVSFDDLVVTKP